MTDIFSDMQFWHWFCLASLFFLGEMSLPGAVLIWPAVAATVMGFITFAFPDMPWTLSWPLWAVLSVASLLVWTEYRKKNPPKKPDVIGLNQRGHQYIGQTYTLNKATENGRSELSVDDTIWRVVSEDEIPAQTKVKVIGLDGNQLRIVKEL
jgi:membrane protein implicated in regulation of membrane protease activity